MTTPTDGKAGGVAKAAAAAGKASGNAMAEKAGPRTEGPGATKLGAGGTSMARDPEVTDGVVGRVNGGSAGKATAAGAAVPAAGAAGQVMFAMMLLNWLKSMFFASMAMAANFINMLVGAALTVGKAIVGGAMAVGTAVSSFVGGAISAVTGAVSAAVTTAVVVAFGATAVMTGVGNQTAQRDGALFDCSVEVVAAANSVADAPVGGNPAQTTDNAKLIYGVLSAWGMSDENIAGILGNWDAESGIDPTGVETVFGEPFSIGPKKQDAEAKGFDVDKVAPDYGARFPGVDLLGIGFGQWSNGRNTQLLEYARGTGGSWSTIETQLGFMVSADSGAPVIAHMISTPIGSADAAAVYFHTEWERSADTSTAVRETAAKKWFAQMGGWEKNQSLADSIMAQSGAAVSQADQNRVSNAKDNCKTNTKTVGAAGLKDGGLTLEEAQAFMEIYKSVGEAALVAAFGAGGPGDCGYGKADNCVGFSAYFMHEYTSFKQYAPGNGIDMAASVARMTGKSTSSTPTAYSVFSMPTGQPEGHTGIILGIQGDMAIIGEASCGSNHAGTRAYMRPISDMAGWVFTDVSDLLTDEAMAS
ncbi:hypothetical protein ANMWB30_23240 [Arthrobacter sp. MWB30]|nr:hypothetical protein ANMWB30_23240 [Arthrobacter sp. MWB30]